MCTTQSDQGKSDERHDMTLMECCTKKRRQKNYADTWHRLIIQPTMKYPTVKWAIIIHSFLVSLATTFGKWQNGKKKKEENYHQWINEWMNGPDASRLMPSTYLAVRWIWSRFHRNANEAV